jgi:hypothetical protein
MDKKLVAVEELPISVRALSGWLREDIENGGELTQPPILVASYKMVRTRKMLWTKSVRCSLAEQRAAK